MLYLIENALNFSLLPIEKHFQFANSFKWETF